jgi:hypothetical protein
MRADLCESLRRVSSRLHRWHANRPHAQSKSAVHSPLANEVPRLFKTKEFRLVLLPVFPLAPVPVVLGFIMIVSFGDNPI